MRFYKLKEYDAYIDLTSIKYAIYDYIPPHSTTPCVSITLTGSEKDFYFITNAVDQAIIKDYIQNNLIKDYK